jgi:AcrR family transcriptional regulator
VLEAADALFYERGLNAVGVAEIVQRAGVAKTSLYLHFASKDDLVAAYLAGRVALYENAWDELLAARAADEPEAVLDAIFDELVGFVLTEGYRGCPFQNAAAELSERDHPGHVPIAEYRRYVREDLFGSIARRAGIADPIQLAEQLQLLYDAALDGSFADSTPTPVERARETAHLVLREALAAGPERAR